MVHSSAYARYTTNKNTLDAQHRCARAFHRQVAGSHTRLAAITPATAAIRLCSETCSNRRTPVTAAASIAVPATARTSRRAAGQTRRPGCAAGPG